jgi:hypothetical protein
MPVQENIAVWDSLYVKGREFDQGDIPTPKEELRKMPGLFKLSDVQDRIPFAANRLKFWYSNPTGPFYRFFPKLPMGDRRSLVYVDLVGLSNELQQRFEEARRP